jgi:hypothetical protein
MEDLLGLRIRRYDPGSADSVAAFTSWLDRHLGIFVQGIPPPYAPSLIQREARRVLAIPPRGLDAGEEDVDAPWLQAIADLDLTTLSTLVAGRSPSPGVWELSGQLVASVSVTRAMETDDYWPTARVVIARSRTLREHYFKLLETPHLLRDTAWSNVFRENLWFALGEAQLTPDDVRRAEALLEHEPDDDIRNVARSVLIEYLPEQQRQEAAIRMMESYLGVAEPAANADGHGPHGGLPAQRDSEAFTGPLDTPPPRRRSTLVPVLALILTAVVAGGVYLALTGRPF